MVRHLNIYRVRAEVSESSVLHGTPSGSATSFANSFQAARATIGTWLGVPWVTKPPRGIGKKYAVTDGDWMMWIEKV